MNRMEKIRNLHYCRACLNEAYQLKLERGDVIIYNFPEECKRCKKVKNIVCKVKKTKQWKLFLYWRNEKKKSLINKEKCVIIFP
jgi:hypothetical protein